MIDTETVRAIADDCARESAEKVEAQRLLYEACRVLARIARSMEFMNSDIDIVGYSVRVAVALEDAVSNAQAFFRLNGLRAEDYQSPPKDQALAPRTPHCPRCGSSDVYVDTTASWDAGGNTWELSGTCGCENSDAVCNVCGETFPSVDLWGEK